MTAIPNYVIACEGPGCRAVHSPILRCVTAKEARASAAGAEWAQITHKGRKVDTCPACARILRAMTAR